MAIDISDTAKVRLNLDTSLCWPEGIDPANILKIDEVYDLGTDEIRDSSKATYRVMVMDKNFEQMTPIGFAEIKKYEKNPAFGKPSDSHQDPSARYDLCRRSTPYHIDSDLVLG